MSLRIMIGDGVGQILKCCLCAFIAGQPRLVVERNGVEDCFQGNATRAY